MSKGKLILINAVIWPIAVILIFFDNYAVRSYYHLVNGDSFSLNQVEYTVNSSAFIIGPTGSGNIGLGYVHDNKLSSLYLKSGSLDEIDELEHTFSNELDTFEESGCKFLLNDSNPNLPYLSWAKDKTNIYLTITDKPEFDIDFVQLCNVVT